MQNERTSNSNPIDINVAKRHFLTVAERHCPGFDVDDENHSVIDALLRYFIRDPAFETLPDLKSPSLNKGILIAGNSGSGKSILLRIMRECRFPGTWFGEQMCRQISQRFAKGGFASIETFGSKAVRYEFGKKKCSVMLFDDLGAEQTVQYFGQKQNVMAEILLDRYDHFLKHGLITHLTTNLDRDAVEERYGNRVLSRMYQQFNFISLGADENATDRRKKN